VTTKIEPIPFNRPYATGKELIYAAEAQRNYHLSGDGPFTKRCHAWIEEQTGCAKALLTHSCTAALEMAALLLKIEPGDEVIMPSYTFVSTANAFVLRGAKPIFVDIREDTLNLNETLIESAITPRTRAIVPVHYAGVACEMDAIIAIAERHGLKVVEDAAQGVMAHYNGRALGAIGDLGAYSFHESKNVISGEGGSLLVNDPTLALRAEIIREKGTDRSRFFRGEVDKYTWQEVGSSFLPSELTAAFLWAQLEDAARITAERGTLAALSRNVSVTGGTGGRSPPGGARGLSAQRPHVLCTSWPGRRSEGHPRYPQPKRYPSGISLCPAAFFTGRTALWSRARRSRAYHICLTAPHRRVFLPDLPRAHHGLVLCPAKIFDCCVHGRISSVSLSCGNAP
jgi:TDP-4-keto-6-deoxy-D-glucose transaminase